MLECKAATTPMSSTDTLSATDGVLLSADDATEYRSIVGGLQYLPSLGLMSPMQLIVSVSIFMHHGILIGLLLSASCAMFIPL
jgi:hypothetical protein